MHRRPALALITIVSLSTALLALGSGAHAHAPQFHEMMPPKTTPSTPELAAFSKRYREALEKKDLAAFRALHDKDVVIFEGGHKNIGWADYEKNHLGPELAAIKSFRFDEWQEASRSYENTGLIVADVAYSIETNEGKTHTAKGVATLVVRRAGATWEIVHSHWSTQRPK